MRHIQIRTVRCPICHASNLIRYLSDQLSVSATCSACGQEIEFDNTEMLLETIIGDL